MKHLLQPTGAVLTLSAALFTATPSQAALVVPTSNRLVVNDTDLNVSWTQDANLFLTQASTYLGGGHQAEFVMAVIDSVGGVIHDTPNFYDTPANSGNRTLTAGDSNTSSGQMNWWGAQAWVSYLK